MNKRAVLSLVICSVFMISCIGHITIDEIVLRDNWYICRADASNLSGKELSSGMKPDKNQIYTTVPSTVLGALCNAGVYKDPFYSMNLEDIPKEQFEVPWWYGKSFDLQGFSSEKEHVQLFLDGINYKANVWLNGQQILSADTASGAFRQFAVDITGQCQCKGNVLAIEVIPPVAGDFYMGFVDWAPVPPDKNMGVYRPVRIRRSGKVSLNNPHVVTDVNLQTLGEASLSVSTDIVNHSQECRDIILDIRVEDQSVSKKLTIQPGQVLSSCLTSDEYKELIIRNPRLWWPNGLGKPDMYTMHLQLRDGKQLLDSTSVRFGIRSIETYLGENGARGYKVNGRKVLIKSAGWVDDLFLRNSTRYNEAQIRYVKEMNLNSLRFEGFWGTSQELYDLCDENGILLMVGWSCQWEWPDYLGLKLDIPAEDQNVPINEGVDKYGVKLTSTQENLLSDMFRDQVIWLRNHPSIFVWAVGSDAMPKPSLEKKYNRILEEYDDTRSLLVSAGEFNSELSGPTGMKMNGPYEYVPPVYWFEDKKLGGAFGFNTETGPGPQIPPVESIKKMIPKDSLWPPRNTIWNFHSGRKDFNDVKVYLDALNKRYGEPRTLEELSMKAQWANYEAIRPMFEAFVVNRPDATGVVQWQLNSAWPEFYWQLYDWYLMPTGAYFGTKKACQPIHILYNYHDRKIYATNDILGDLNHHRAKVDLYDDKSNLLYQYTDTINIMENESVVLGQLPVLPDKKRTYFLKLALYNSESELVADNFYWLSGQEDEMDWSQYYWYYTPQKKFADFSCLNSLQEAQVVMIKKATEIKGEWVIEVIIKNTGSYIAFNMELLLVDKNTGKAILPVFWEDNYVSLMGHESKKIVVRCYESDSVNEPDVILQGVNIQSVKQ